MEHRNSLLPNGTLLRNGTYRIEHHLGSGGFGCTYLVKHLGFDAEMVVKEFFMKGINLRDAGNTVTVSVPDNRATFESQREKFKKEAQRLWKIKSDHIVSVHDIFEENGTVYYSMDFIGGESMEARLKRERKPMQEDEVRDILNQLLDALAAIHGSHPIPIFHLDIKPGNIMMGKDGKVVLIDFGASKQLSAEHDGVSSTLMSYTKGYAPSEQIDGKPEHIGPWTDLYALGATLYKLMTTNPPPEPSEIINEGEDAFHFPSQVSGQMRKLILWMMTPNRRKRPQSVAEVRAFLDEEPVESDSEDTSGEDTEDTMMPADKSKEKPKPLFIESVWTNHKKAIVYIITAVLAVVLAVVFWPKNEFSNNTSSVLSETFIANGVSFKMIRVEGNGSPFYIGETEVTQALWQAVMGSNPSCFKGSNRPVEKVSWDECKTFISKLNAITGKTFRLPREAEWEYAAKGGNKSRGYEYSGCNSENELEQYAWYDKNAYYCGSSSANESHPDYGTHNVKIKKPNELGIYDMSGNVWEWCEDLYNSSGSNRVFRGGGWLSLARVCRVSYRNNDTPDDRYDYLGLRLAL